MRRIPKQQEIRMKRQLQPWMARRELPPVLFDKLHPHNKVLLYGIVCVGNVKPTDSQLRALLKDLGLDDSRSEGERGGHYPTIDELREYFSPDGTPYQRKY